ncbi:rhomboid family intramembrane serine protease [Candidatus Nanohalobium constans]|uniref:Rhomboid family intramembrane serine protease n=1 Tax=Candidatus Nanohalobium constans TaxID=2565781 RepID=A0A5Q0UFE8_9ARCH|nr:rhomboid family intramembrane serine protease [Candidatus Nanohalobium constans]QGA80091.1 rhomboid family intramembrane serine protease [Candidatus Nanohalobium constans]
MVECSECGKQSMSFTCRYCGGKFCSEHRLPEKHDCNGLESGKKEEYSTSSDSEDEEDQKWFDDKFKDKKKPEKQYQKPSMLNETKRILRNNITLVVIGLTVASFLLHQASPAFRNFLTLSPALTETAVNATNQATQELGIGNVLDKTLLTAPWGILTVMLVHGSFIHIAANMITFYFFGTAVERAVGGLEMLKIYLIAGIGSSIGYIIFRNLLYLIHGPIAGNISLAPAVGASGAVIAMFSVVAMLYPKAEVLLYFIIPMKIKTAFRLFAGLELINLIAILAGIRLPVLGGFASSAHLAGLAIGLYFGKKLQEKHKKRSSAFNPLGY